MMLLMSFQSDICLSILSGITIASIPYGLRKSLLFVFRITLTSYLSLIALMCSRRNVFTVISMVVTKHIFFFPLLLISVFTILISVSKFLPVDQSHLPLKLYECILIHIEFLQKNIYFSNITSQFSIWSMEISALL